MSDLTFEVPLRITVSLGSAAPSTGICMKQKSDAGAGPGLERGGIDYSNRKGYDPNFLGIAVPLPVLTDEQRRSAAKNSKARSGEDSTVLPYHHFSIVMNRRRQLAYYTAVNIDGARSRDLRRTKDPWCYDSRIAESEQIGGELYVRNQLDRGHLVRRLDPCWGSEDDAVAAELDTFTYTNCSPQHAQFNQNDETWQGIENYLLGSAQQQGSKMTIFTGPITTEEDPLYRGIRLPMAFWKIAVTGRKDKTLEVSAYILEQTELIKDLDGLERFEPQTFQVTVEEICERTGLNFNYLAEAQVEVPAASEGPERAWPYARRPLAQTRDICLNRRKA